MGASYCGWYLHTFLSKFYLNFASFSAQLKGNYSFLLKQKKAHPDCRRGPTRSRASTGRKLDVDWLLNSALNSLFLFKWKHEIKTCIVINTSDLSDCSSKITSCCSSPGRFWLWRRVRAAERQRVFVLPCETDACVCLCWCLTASWG